MLRTTLMLIGFTIAPALTLGCGLDWTLPHAHFDGVEEHGYVAYWEKIGEVDMGNGLVIPVNINFNSHREASSAYLGKGWLVALLESHIEPIDENSMHVIMPDGWTFIFLRNGNTETWRGNSGWVGETKNTIFTITAPCGWRIKFDQGKIQEIDSNTNQTFSYKYNAGVATEVDENGKPFVRVESNTTTGMTTDLVIGDQKIIVTLAQRPRVMLVSEQNLITGFDQSLNQLQWPDGKKESFTFGTDKSLNPTLAITHIEQSQRNFVWDPTTRQIKVDGEWVYKLTPGNNVTLDRSTANGRREYWFYEGTKGEETTLNADGTKKVKSWFTSGKLFRKPRSEIITTSKGDIISSTKWAYDENGHLIRVIKDNITLIIENGYLTDYYNNNKMWSINIPDKEIK